MAIDWFAIAAAKKYGTPKLMFQKLYLVDGLSIPAIAEMMGCSAWTVSAALGEFGVPKRSHGGARRKKPRAITSSTGSEI